MKVMVVKEWLAAPRSVGKFVDLPDNIAKSGIERGLCLTPQDALEELQRKEKEARARLNEAQQAIQELEKSAKETGDVEKEN